MNNEMDTVQSIFFLAGGVSREFFDEKRRTLAQEKVVEARSQSTATIND